MKLKIYYILLFILVFSFIPFLTKSENLTVICGSGAFSEYTPFTSIPTYDYGPDGLVRFHISLNPDGWVPMPYFYSTYFRLAHYSVDCQKIRSDQVEGSIPVGVSHVLIKVIEVSPGWYSFESYNEDTGEMLGDSHAFPGPFSEPIVEFSTYWPHGASNIYGYFERGVWTSIVPVKDPNFIVAKTPVLIVPGILGTELWQGDEPIWLEYSKLFSFSDNFLDVLSFESNLLPQNSNLNYRSVIRKINPLGSFKKFDYTDGLINEFISQGYIEGKDLFTFPYDWRYGVSGKFENGSTTVEQLKGQIDYILTQTDADKSAGKLDVIAHSTGGLLLKKYVIDHPTDHHVNKALFVGVPNLGVPKAFKVLIDGDNFGVTGLNSDEMKKISQNMPVVYDLAPSQVYYQTKGSFYHLADWDPSTMKFPQSKDLSLEEAYERLTQIFAGNLQAVSNAKDLHSQSFDNYDLRTVGVDAYNVVGCKSGTVGSLYEYKSRSLLGNTQTSFEAPKLVSGDGTVPFESANSIQSDASRTYFVPKADHGKMLSEDGTRQLIVNLLAGSSLNVGDKIITHDQLVSNQGLCQLNGRVIKIKSPVAISITDQAGNFSGLAEDGSVQNDISGADYEVWGEHKYVFLPTDEGQTYTIKLQGTGNGTFTVNDQTIVGDNVVKTQVFSNLPVTSALTGQVNLGSGSNETTLLLQETPTSTQITIHPSSILNSNESQDLIPPVSTSTIEGTLGQPGFYRSNATVILSSIDPVIEGKESETSGILKTSYSLDGGEYQVYASSSPIIVTTEGSHTIKFYSTDRAGNNEFEQEINFVIDKTPPELIIQFDPVIRNLQFTASDTTATIIITSTTSAVIKPGDSNNDKGKDDDENKKNIITNTVTATDAAGNIINLVYTIKKDGKQELKATILSLSYNNSQPVSLNNASLSFDWELNRAKQLKELEQKIQNGNKFKVKARFENNKTKLSGKDQSGKINLKLPGLVLLKLITNHGEFGWGY
ncbi:MAG: hypothetical protein AAB729_00870 [Patescibacteria group bacterium]